MARMSAEKRIELGTQMVERWTAANQESDRSVRFVKDMLVRLGRGKGLTKRQREWYDSAVLTEPQKPQNEELVNRLLAASEMIGMEKVSQPLKDFAFKLSKGWNLSEKQTAFMNKLLAQADEIVKNGVWQPTPEQKQEIETGVAFSRRYNDYYLDSCPGIRSALLECKAWLAGDKPNLDKWSAEKVIGLCKGDRKIMADASERWPEGSLVNTKLGQIGLVLCKPGVDSRGKPCLNLLIEGKPVDVTIDMIKKERKKRAKAVA